MKLMILVPKVVQSFINKFPETTNNAYKYFNYDRRVYDERAETRFDVQAQYKGPEDLTDNDYDTIVTYAKTLINPILSKYSFQVACEDALHMAIRSYNRGIYDGKVNASKYEVLLGALLSPTQAQAPGLPMVMLAKKKVDPKKADPKKKPVVIPQNIVKRLNLKKAPLKSQVRKVQQDADRIVKDKGRFIIDN